VLQLISIVKGRQQKYVRTNAVHLITGQAGLELLALSDNVNTKTRNLIVKT